MDAIELNNLIKQGNKIKIFDVRDKSKYDFFHIKGSTNITKGLLLSNHYKYFNKNEKVYIICNSGNSSSLITNIIKKDGYNVESVKNGMNPLLLARNKEK